MRTYVQTKIYSDKRQKTLLINCRQCKGKQLNQLNLWTFRCPEDRETHEKHTNNKQSDNGS